MWHKIHGTYIPFHYKPSLVRHKRRRHRNMFIFLGTKSKHLVVYCPSSKVPSFFSLVDLTVKRPGFSSSHNEVSRITEKHTFSEGCWKFLSCSSSVPPLLQHHQSHFHQSSCLLSIIWYYYPDQARITYCIAYLKVCLKSTVLSKKE